MRKYRLGVLGLGEGRSIISAGLQSELWEVTQLCDLNETLGRARCREFGINCFTTSMDELLANPEVDVIGIYTPDHLHAEHVIRSIRAGKHVICTKPFLNDLSRAAEILAVQEETGREVMVGQSSRFFPPFRRQRQHFESGAFGELETVEAAYHADHRWFLAKPWAQEAAFKWLFAGSSHPVDFIRWYLPDIEEVMGYASLSANGRAGGLKNADTFHFIMKSASGKTARMSGCFSCPILPSARGSGLTCILRCEKGASQGDYPELRYASKLDGKSVIEQFEGQENYYFRFEGHTHHAGEYQNYIEYLARCLDAGQTPLPDAREGIVTVALMQAMEESAREGRPVKLRDVLARAGLADLLDGCMPPEPAVSSSPLK